MSEHRRIVLVVAAARNNVIGRDGGLPWRLPNDLKHFKAVTMGHPIVMGRRTWDELGRSPLPGRDNVVLTRDKAFDSAGCTVLHTPEAVREHFPESDLMIVGGGQVYRLFLDVADTIERTVVHADVEGDTTFPQIPYGWTRVWFEDHAADDRHEHAFTFERWTRD